MSLLTAKAAAMYLGKPGQPDFIYDLIALGELPYVRMGKKGKRIDPADLQAWIEKNKVRAI